MFFFLYARTRIRRELSSEGMRERENERENERERESERRRVSTGPDIPPGSKKLRY